MDNEVFTILPFRSQLRAENDPAMPSLDVGLCRSTNNVCELRGCGRCDTGAGVYYGNPSDPVTWFCPRHWYELHFGPNAAYRLIDAFFDQETQPFGEGTNAE